MLSLIGMPLLGVGMLVSPGAGANGWEHTSIDFEVLVGALNDVNPRLRQRAAESLGFRPQAATAQALISRLAESEPDARVRQAIYLSLGKVGAKNALPDIENCLESESHSVVKAQCAGALGNIITPKSEQLALKALDDDSGSVRRQAIMSLGAFPTTRVVRRLIALSKNEPSLEQNTALLALARTGSVDAAAVLLDALRKARKRAQKIIVLRALTVLAEPATAAPIRQTYTTSADEEIKRHALVALANTRAAGSQTQFLDALSSQDTKTRLLGLSVLRNFASANEVAAIVEHGLQVSRTVFVSDNQRLLRDPRRTLDGLQLVNAYLKTVTRLDPSRAERLYLHAAKAPVIPRHSAAHLKIADAFYTARWQALYGLGYSKNERAGRVISDALGDADARIRAVATRSLGVMQLPKYHDSIAAMLADDAAEVRWTAARVLGRLRVVAVSAQLVKSLYDPNAQVRLEATLALGYLRASMARTRLHRLVSSDSDARVREAASYALSLIY